MAGNKLLGEGIKRAKQMELASPLQQRDDNELLLLRRRFRRLHLYAARFITRSLDTIFLLHARLLSCRHLAGRAATAVTMMMKEAATGQGQSTEQEQGEEGEAFIFHLYSPCFADGIARQISGMRR
jgi:hypothetical protein